MDAPRGRGAGGRARGRGRGGGGQATNRGAQAPLAAQLRQLDRLQEPDEMAVLRRYKDLGAIQVRSVYGQNGLLDRSVLLPGPHAVRAVREAPLGRPTWLSLIQTDQALQHLRAEEEQERALARREVRLPEGRRRLSWGQLSPEERRLLLLSQKEFNSFRPRRGTAGTAPQQAPAQQAPPMGTQPIGSTSHGEEDDGGDDASDEETEEGNPPPGSSQCF